MLKQVRCLRGRKSKRRHLRCESLENRHLMTADLVGLADGIDDSPTSESGNLPVETFSFNFEDVKTNSLSSSDTRSDSDNLFILDPGCPTCSSTEPPSELPEDRDTFDLVSTSHSSDDDSDHDIIYDPDGDLTPPAGPLGGVSAEGGDSTSRAESPHQGRIDTGGYVPTS